MGGLPGPEYQSPREHPITGPLLKKIDRLEQSLPFIVYAIYYGDFGDEGVTFEHCREVWTRWMLSSLTKEHDGDCVKQPQACARCQTEDCIRIADLLKDALERENDEPQRDQDSN